MPRKFNISQLKSKLRQAAQKQKQAINKYNNEVRKHNQKVRQNRSKLNSAINSYNSEVRKHNARVRANQTRLRQEVARLQSSSKKKRYNTYTVSSQELAQSYVEMNRGEESILSSSVGARFLDLSEKEAADSLEAANGLNEPTEESPDSLNTSVITTELSAISEDLDNRWKGALYALSPSNPDAARHFCSGTREIFISILDHFAPDGSVKNEVPDCEFTPQGAVTRKSKIRYILLKHGVTSAAAADFVHDDVGNILTLFGVFNDGTHGEAGKFSLTELSTLKQRTEAGILYLSEVCSL